MKILVLFIILSSSLFSQNLRLLREDARELLKQKKYEQVIKVYDLIIDLKPNDYEALFKRGLSYGELGKDSLAILDFDKAIDLKPENIYIIYYNRSYSYSRIGNHKQAIFDLDTAIMFNDEYPNSFNNRAMEYESIGDFKSALSDYTRAISLDSTNWTYYYNIGRIYEATNQNDLAVSFLSIALTAKPNNTDILKLRASSLAKMQEFEKAEKDYSTYLKVIPDDPDALLKHGFCLIYMGDKIEGCMQLSLAKEYGNPKAEQLIQQFCK